ncbi:formate dehydrogenase (quinone-dependent) catalytic subunit [Sporomusa malonica]|uniref:Formate dehydrogenase (Quinone-dependent) catalytic subunit n=2 Tax=Sporomusa malonica TaxID=112901 RepID=A0A1W1YGH1_9FIRM|nr:formate dehydrogenase (quinone-dependent) catalytic subunit [Sporomusa malonica]
MENSDWFLIAGSNCAENHPIAMKYVLRAQAKGAKVIVVDPRFTRTASKADLFAQIRPGTDIAYLGAIINYILQNNLYNKDYLLNFTNATCKIKPEYSFKDGLFTGFDSAKKSYDNSSWGYVLDESNQPVKAEFLEEDGTVFSILKKHYSRYTLEMAAAVTGIPAATIKQIADTMAKGGTGSILYALGMTQKTTASQGIRCYGIIQFLLGNIGKAGGGVNALRGEPNVQASSDMANLSDIMPGYIPTPIDADTTTAAYGKRNGAFNQKHLISILKAWFGDKATAENDYCYNYLPRRQTGKDTRYISMLEDMVRGQFKLLLNVAINPLVSIPNNQVVAAALAKLEMMVNVDIFQTETANFWNAPGVKPEDIKTEVIMLPAAYLYEKAGSMTNSSRWIQWKTAAVNPEGETLPDLDILDLLFKKVRELYAGSSNPKDAPILNAVWDYGHEPDPEKVLQEINGYNMKTGKLNATLGEYLAAPVGEVSSGCWIYAGVFGNGNLAKRRGTKDPSGLGMFHDWSYAWPANIRILYNRASCNAQGQPVDEKRKLIWWDAFKGQWGGNDIPDVIDRTKGPDTPEGKPAFRMNAERMGRLFLAPFANRPVGAEIPTAVSAMLPDGPLPEHFEPVESPTGNVLHPNTSANPCAPVREVLKGKQDIGTSDKYPYVLTTYGGGTEQFCSGSLTRNLPWLNELRPETFVEMGAALAKKLDIKYGEIVEVYSARGSIKIKALVTERIQPLKINGKEVHTLGIPFGWGHIGIATGPGANALTHGAGDPAAGTPEYKATQVNVRKVK